MVRSPLKLIVAVVALLVVSLACNAAQLVASGGEGSTPQPAKGPVTPENVLPTSTARPTPIPTFPPAPTEVTPQCVIPVVSGDEIIIAPREFVDYPQAILGVLNLGLTFSGLEEVLEAAGVANQPVSVATGDLDADGKDDVVVSIFDPASPLVPPAGVLLIFTCERDHYVLAAEMPTGEGAGGPKIWFLQDLNADGAGEVVVSTATCGAHTCFEKVRVIAWDGAAFGNRLEMDTSALPFPLVEITDPEGDGIYALEVTGSGFGSVGAGPQRPLIVRASYDPDTQTWRKSAEIMGPSSYRLHVLHDADRAAAAGDYQTALAGYQRVVADPTLEDWLDPASERLNLSAYARFKMVLVYSLLGQEDFVQVVLDEMRAAYPAGSPQSAYLAMAERFLEASGSGGFPAGCAAVENYAESHTQEILLPLNSFGYANPGYTAADLCLP